MLSQAPLELIGIANDVHATLSQGFADFRKWKFIDLLPLLEVETYAVSRKASAPVATLRAHVPVLPAGTRGAQASSTGTGHSGSWKYYLLSKLGYLGTCI